jgi:hypothetical protein
VKVGIEAAGHHHLPLLAAAPSLPSPLMRITSGTLADLDRFSSLRTFYAIQLLGCNTRFGPGRPSASLCTKADT